MVRTARPPTTQQKLVALYENAIKRLTEIITKKQSAGSAAAYERSLLRQVNEELKKLKKYSRKTVQGLAEESYKIGLHSLVEDLLKDHQAPRVHNMMSGLNQSQILLIAQNTNADLNKAINLVGRRVQDAIREASIEATAEKLTTGQTVRKMQKNLEKMLEQQNLTAIEYANGTKMPIEKYAETVARSTTAETQNKAKIVQGRDWGYDLVRFTEHTPTCSVCAMYQGRVYALTKAAANGKYKGTKGQRLRFPYLYDTALVKGYSTIHPNCRHRISVLPARAYTAAEMEAFSRRSMQPFEDTRSDAERKAYATEQAVKRKRNESRRQYERIKAALPNDAPKTFAAFVKMKSAKSERYKELLSDYRSVMRVAKQEQSGIIPLTDVETVALNQYLSSQSYTINEKLRTDTKLTESEKVFVNNLDLDLEKMPEYTGTVYRSITSDMIDDLEQFWNLHQPDKIVGYKAYTSTSLEIYDNTMDIQYVIQSKSGRNITSFNQNEQEILFKRDSKFLVLKIEEGIIHMKEL